MKNINFVYIVVTQFKNDVFLYQFIWIKSIQKLYFPIEIKYLKCGKIKISKTFLWYFLRFYCVNKAMNNHINEKSASTQCCLSHVLSEYVFIFVRWTNFQIIYFSKISKIFEINIILLNYPVDIFLVSHSFKFQMLIHCDNNISLMH